jgi:hypothetical protein
MEKAIYKRQVALLLNVLPEIAKEKGFALHGGTAINLFVRDMPRLLQEFYRIFYLLLKRKGYDVFRDPLHLLQPAIHLSGFPEFCR